jgi:hypothetical protein
MRKWGIVLIGLGLLATRLTTDVKVRAQQGCTVQSLKGPFVYRFDGNYFDNQGYNYQYSSVGRVTPDGNGALTATETNSIFGTVKRNATYTGTYTVNTDCSGSMVFQYTGGSMNYDFVFIPATNQLHMIESDQGVTISGSATALFAPTPPTTTTTLP